MRDLALYIGKNLYRGGNGYHDATDDKRPTGKCTKPSPRQSPWRKRLRDAFPEPGDGILSSPPFYGPRFRERDSEGEPVRLSAQNMHWEAQGAYTGEISAAMPHRRRGASSSFWVTPNGALSLEKPGGW